MTSMRTAPAAVPIKDFRRPEQYPRWGTVAPWRWEFLRRDVEYQRYFAEHCGGDATEERATAMLSLFGLRILIDPMQDERPPGLFDYVPGGSVIDTKWIERGSSFPFPPSTVLVAIDLSAPLDPQFAAARVVIEARAEYEGQQPALRRSRVAELRNYVRVLDGRADGATDDEIAAAVFPEASNEYPDYPGRKRVEKAHQRATILAATFGRRTRVPEK